mmetsp:Transcript_13612/g.33317  ORF Transcript_13612/g.33317 Transcript_13612/m.33317 type:complete len:387 (-) Transcript_13612:577-1737(-)|eukprot:CAMPEP_0114514688 /NCGR_PEP_ID=MMETSP0109-20121206/16295_1 /TAXON_ID=29199 /ORGANISM="Chlorarachnion reptans, Strain CCCM449" /LENGTH=386 /DNA_ID=CAMNT_0001694761 /DNA_START=327 /DNA_END=1487 /DNA_ORIENTATION=-
MAEILVGTRTKYRVKQKIGSGSFGDIYEGESVSDKEKVAIKLENKNTRYPQLLYEYQVYRAIDPAQGFPVVHWCGSAGRCNVMVMELLGSSLESLYVKCGRRFSMKTVLMLAIQLIDRIEHQHKNHFLHRDIKPDNFLMGRNSNRHTVYVIDMGLSKRFEHPTSLEHIAYRNNKKFTGTPRYASINTHHGVEQSRRDDLESLGYMLMYFNLGKLPWQGLKARTKQEKYDKIGNKKMDVPIPTLCKGFPKEFELYLTYCRQLGFSEKPNYPYIRALFTTVFKNCGYKDDWIFDWMKDEPGAGSNRGGIGQNRISHRQELGRSNGQAMMESYRKLQAERDDYKRRFDQQGEEIDLLETEVKRLRKHIESFCTQPYPISGAGKGEVNPE